MDSSMSENTGGLSSTAEDAMVTADARLTADGRSVGSFCNPPFMFENVTGLATSVSAVIAVLISSYVLRLQLRDKQELQRDRELGHASRVSCWADWSSDGIPVLSGALLRHPVVTVANRTDEPVFGAFVDYRDQTDGHPIRVDVGTVPQEL